MLSRSSIEAYVGIAIAVVVTVFTLTWWVKASLVLVLAYMVCDVSLHSSWTLKLPKVGRSLVCLVALAVLGSFSWRPVYEQYREEVRPLSAKIPPEAQSKNEALPQHNTASDEKPQPTKPLSASRSPQKAKKTGANPLAQHGSTEKNQPPPSQSCPNGICIGGDNAGTAIVNNYGQPSPPPLQLNWTARDIVPSERNEFTFEREVTVTVNTPYTPVAVAIICDSEIGMIAHGLKNGEVSFNVHEGIDADKKKAFVYFEGAGVTPRNPLLIRLWSNQPLSVLAVGRARIPGIND
jgi:hypothetical protein